MGEEPWGLAATDKQLEELVEAYQHRYGAVVVGADGAGRAQVATAALRRAFPGATVRRARAGRGDERGPFEILRSLGFAPPDIDATPSFAAQHIRGQHAAQVLAIVIDDIDFADAQSVRVLATLARQRSTVVAATARDQGATNVQLLELPSIEIAPLSSEMTSRLVSGRLRTRVLDRDVRWLEAVSGQNYAALRWLVETCDRNGQIDRSRPTARITIPDDDVTPAWELLPVEISAPLGRVLAILGEAPLPLLRDLAGSQAIAEAEESGAIVIDGSGSLARLVNQAIGLDAFFRTGKERRRLVIEQILSHSSDPSAFTRRGAANLVLVAHQLGLKVPGEIGDLAIPELVRLGYPEVARHFEPRSSETAAELVLADVCVGDVESVVARCDSWFGISRASNADDTATAAMALTLGELRFGSDGPVPGLLDRTIAIVDEADPEGADVLRSFQAIVRPTVTMPDLGPASPGAGNSLRDARRRQALAFWHLMDGRPEQAATLAAREDLQSDGRTIDGYLGGVLRFLTQLATPNLHSARRSLPPRAPRSASYTGENVLWAALAVYDGNPASAFVTLEMELPNLRSGFPTIVSAAHATMALCASFIGDRVTARQHLPLAMEPSSSPLLEAVRLFALASATAALRRGAGVREANILYAQASAAATYARARALTLPSVLGQILLFRRARRRLGDARMPELRERPSRPFDGVFALYFELAQANARADYSRVAAIAVEMHNRGLLLEALGAATSIPMPSDGAALSRTLERAVNKLARRRPAGVSSSKAMGLLTQRENEVAALVQAGLTDREIAKRLYLSVRTVGVHVGRILKKLGVSTRHQVGPALDDVDRHRE